MTTEPTASQTGDEDLSIPRSGGADVAEGTDAVSHEGATTHTTTPDTDDAPAAEAADVEASEASDAAPSDQALKSSRKADLEREGEVAADFLETLMDIADLDGDLEVDVDGDRASVSIVDSDEGSVPRRLIGPQGSALEALQELTRLAVQAETGDRSRLMLDVGGHREGRRQELIGVASKAVDMVKAQGERQPLDPMTAFERKVVHDEVLRSGLQSASEGEEPRRYVVVIPAS